MFIVIEGLDGVGKTTAAKLLAARLHGEFFPWLHPPYTNALPLIWDDNAVSEASKHLAFLAAFKHMSDIAGSDAFRDKTIVTDRYYFCSLAMHRPLALLEKTEALNVNISALGFRRADFAFYLALDEQERQRRLASRGLPLSPVERLLAEHSDLCRQITQNYEDMVDSGLMKRIEIDRLSEEEIVAQIITRAGLAPI